MNLLHYSQGGKTLCGLVNDTATTRVRDVTCDKCVRLLNDEAQA